MIEAERNSQSSRHGYFRDKSVVVTGASSGVGYDVALGFGSQGAQVALLARRRPELEALAQRINAAGGSALAIQCDVTRCAQVLSAIDQASRQFGKIDILVNSAGLLIPDTVEQMRPEDLERMMGVNLYGAAHAIQAVLPGMKRRRGGRIINIASLAAVRGMSPLGAYSASKFALIGLSEALRVELFGSGVSVSMVMPGLIDSPMMREARGNATLRAIPSMFAMPAGWVTWAVFAAAVFGLTEIDVPPGSATLERIAALFPAATDTLLGAGTWLLRQWGERMQKAEAAIQNGWQMPRAWRAVSTLASLPRVALG